MSNKELLERADKRIAEVEDIKDTRRNIEDIERLNRTLMNEITFIVLKQGTMEELPDKVLDGREFTELKGVIETKFNEFLQRRILKMEKLLGIRKPATINPEFEAAVQGMVQSVKKPKLVAETSNSKYLEVEKPEPDPVEEKLSAILKQEEAKHNPKKGKQTNIYPEGMTVEAVTQMYINEKQPRKVIADHFGVNASAVNNFLFRHSIKRDENRDNKPSKKKPEETERP